MTSEATAIGSTPRFEANSLASLIGDALGPGFVPRDGAGVMITDVCDDSRKVTPGSLFVAVAGTKARGAAFANEAVAKGAVAVVTDADIELGPGPRVIQVPDARIALAAMAATFYGLKRLQDDGRLRVIGITGTNGKSTTAFMLRGILQAAGRKTGLFGTIEYDLGSRTETASLTTPDAITLTKGLVEAHAAGAGYVVMEVSSHSLDQRRTDGVRFSTAIFTNLTQDHLDYHRTREEYLRAKKRLFDILSTDAVALVNADDDSSDGITADCRARVLRYGIDRPADCRGRVLEEGRSGSRFVLERAAGPFEIYTPMVGRHNAANALAAASAALGMGLEPKAIQQGLGELNHVPGRLQPVDTFDLGFGVYVDYAHTDDALRNVLRAVRPLTHGKLWCVFGCGGDRDQTKRPLMARAVAELADAFVITSDNPRTEDPLAIIADIERGLSAEDRARSVTEPDRTCAIGYAISRLSAGDTLVIAGKGHEKYQILGAEKMHFDDVEVAEGALRRRARR